MRNAIILVILHFEGDPGSHETEALHRRKIAFALRQHEAGTAVPDIVGKMGISEQTFYRWKKKYGGLGVAELRRFKQLEEENRKLKQLV